MNKKFNKFTKKNERKIVFITVLAIVTIAVALITCLHIMPIVNNNIRKDRITAIFNSLKLDENNYIPNNVNIFGDKRVYSYDSSRTFSSSIDFIRDANVDATVAELEKAITDADFVYFEEPYPGSSFTQLHYKSSKNEYLRLTVSSKLRNDYIFNKLRMGVKMTDADYNTDPNAGPSSVTIKVNLDDNNE